ncbi:MAG: TlpA family protein disulfide reductase [Balneolaceae bacterium]
MFVVFFSLLIVVLGCSATQDPGTYISGQITVDPDIDSTEDYSNIELLVATRDTQGTPTDTLFYATTDQQGYFSGTARINRPGVYPFLLSRGGNPVGVISAVLAKGDTVRIDSELPHIEERTTVSSNENRAFDLYERLETNFNRVARFIDAGLVAEDSVTIELQKWSDLYWDLYNQEHGTYASIRSATSSVTLLEGWNDSLMIDRIHTVLDRDLDVRATMRRQAVRYYAEREGLDRSLQFLDRVQSLSTDPDRQLEIKAHRIELLFDSARTIDAEQRLAQFRRDYAGRDEAIQWADIIAYELQTFAPGQPFPDFSFVTTDGETITNSTLAGQPYMLEFTRLDNPLYLEQFERTVAIYHVYSNFGLNILTVPLGTSPVVLEAFFEERVKLWEVAEPGTFDAEEIVEFYNLRAIPTRFLVDDAGNIIRRYTHREYDQIVRGLQQVITQQEAEL